MSWVTATSSKTASRGCWCLSTTLARRLMPSSVSFETRPCAARSRKPHGCGCELASTSGCQAAHCSTCISGCSATQAHPDEVRLERHPLKPPEQYRGSVRDVMLWTLVMRREEIVDELSTEILPGKSLLRERPGGRADPLGQRVVAEKIDNGLRHRAGIARNQRVPPVPDVDAFNPNGPADHRTAACLRLQSLEPRA